MRRSITALFALFWLTLNAQIVILKPPRAPQRGQTNDPCGQTAAISPNLQLHVETHLRGTITDPNGKPLKSTRVELRTLTSQNSYRTVDAVRTDASGYFNFGATQAGGSYRLVVDTKRYAQPSNMVCDDLSDDCNLQIQLENASPYSSLPDCNSR